MIGGIANWHEFFSVTAGIAATLSGLVFVAVSINLMQILSFPGTVTLALESLTQMLGAMTIALAGLLPGQTDRQFSAETLVLTVLLWVIQTRWQISFLRLQARHPWQWTANRFLRTQLSCTPFFVAGMLLWSHHASAMFWFAPGLALSFIAGVANAWVLLVKVVMIREATTTAREALACSQEG